MTIRSEIRGVRLGAAAALTTLAVGGCGSGIPSAVGQHHASAARQALPAASGLAHRSTPFSGAWIRHGSYLCVGGDSTLLLTAKATCPRSGKTGWIGFYFGCYRFPGTRADVCYEWDYLSFNHASSDRILASVTKVIYTGRKGATIRGFALPHGFRMGDSFYLERIAPGLLKMIYQHTRLTGLALTYGPPYWCGQGVTTARRPKCGA